MNNNKGLQPFDISALYAQRMVLFLEMEPQSNHYHQILFSKEELHKFNTFLSTLFPMPPEHKADDGGTCKCTKFIISNEGIDLPDLLSVHECSLEQIESGECKH